MKVDPLDPGQFSAVMWDIGLPADRCLGGHRATRATRAARASSSPLFDGDKGGADTVARVARRRHRVTADAPVGG